MSQSCLGFVEWVFAYFFGIEIFLMAGHMFSQAKDLHLLADGRLDDIF